MLSEASGENLPTPEGGHRPPHHDCHTLAGWLVDAPTRHHGWWRWKAAIGRPLQKAAGAMGLSRARRA